MVTQNQLSGKLAEQLKHSVLSQIKYSVNVKQSTYNQFFFMLFYIFIMQVSISSITIPPTHPRRFAPKFAPTLGLLHPSFCPWGSGICQGSSREAGISLYKRCLPFLTFSLYWQELTTDNTLGFPCCSEILYVLQKNYSILD